MEEINTHGMICDFGRHKGVLYTRLPVSYLKWMVRNNHHKKDIAESELKRRGTVTPTLDISGHAIDRASLQCIEMWKATSSPDEGLHAWLARMSQLVLGAGLDKDGRGYRNGIRFVFDVDGEWPVLKTVIKINGNRKKY